MESEEQNDYSEYTSLKGYQNINEESNYKIYIIINYKYKKDLGRIFVIFELTIILYYKE
jgi:hypothetical protein